MSSSSSSASGVRRSQRTGVDGVGQAKKQAPAEDVSFDFTIRCKTGNIIKVIRIPCSELQGAYLANRTVKGVKRGQLSGEDEVLLPTGVSFKGLLCRVDGNLVKNVKRTLENFATFVEGLSENGKHYQVIAELENLAHMKSCVDEMLDKNGLNF